jgi:hypothetical protein
MKRSGFTNRGKPLAQGDSTLKRSPMARGDSTLARTPMNRGEAQLARSDKPMAAVGQRAKRMRQGKVPPNAQEQAWMDAVSEFGCIVCWLQHQVKTPCAVHHPIVGGRRVGHLATIGLCDPGHHQNSPTRDKISRHPNKARFEAAYGTEAELLEALKILLG